MVEKLSIKKNIRMMKFDSSQEQTTYLLVNGKRHFEISEHVYYIICSLRKNLTQTQIRDALIKKYNISVPMSDLEDIINITFLRLGIYEGTKDHGKGNGSSYLWLKIEPIKSSLVVKFKLLSNLFHKRVSISLSSFSIATIIFYIIWFFMNDGITKLVTISPSTVGWVITIGLITALCHEFGHMCALMKYNLEPGNIGLAFYFLKPVMYSDVTSVWQLSSRKRVIIDVGGIYFESLILSIIIVISFVTNQFNLLYGLSIFVFGLSLNLNPFFKWDGYWIFSDLIGVANLHQKMMTYFRSIIFRNKKDRAFLKQMNKRSSACFKVYAGISVGFILYFSSIMIKILVSISQQKDALLSILDIVNQQNPMNYLWLYIKNHGVTILMLLILMRILMVTLVKVVKMFSKRR